MASAVTSKDCFYGGKRYRKGDTLDYKGAKKDLPKYFTLTEQDDDKSPSASDIVKIIKAAETVDEISEYAEDDRKTVKEAYQEKLNDLEDKRV
jgi:hypothetical protein